VANIDTKRITGKTIRRRRNMKKPNNGEPKFRDSRLVRREENWSNIPVGLVGCGGGDGLLERGRGGGLRLDIFQPSGAGGVGVLNG